MAQDDVSVNQGGSSPLPRGYTVFSRASSNCTTAYFLNDSPSLSPENSDSCRSLKMSWNDTLSVNARCESECSLWRRTLSSFPMILIVFWNSSICFEGVALRASFCPGLSEGTLIVRTLKAGPLPLFSKHPHPQGAALKRPPTGGPKKAWDIICPHRYG